MKSPFVLIGVAAMLASCVGDAQFVLEQPVATRCASARLQSCRTLTEAALLYANGNPVDGRHLLLEGLRDNHGKSAELEQFALGLEETSAVSSGGQFQAPLQPAVWLVRQTAERDARQASLTSFELPVTNSPATAGARPPSLNCDVCAIAGTR